MSSEKHQGEIARKAIKDSGYTFIHVAKKLNISRNTLYARFHEEVLPPHFLYQIGQAVNHDFVVDIPELRHNKAYLTAVKNDETAETRYNKQMVGLQIKYYQTLEDYNKLLRFLVKIVNDNKFYSLKKEIHTFVESDIEE